MHISSPDSAPGVGLHLDDHVDLGSWSTFTPSLADFLSRCLPDDSGLMVLLTAPAPVVNTTGAVPRRGLRGFFSRRRPVPSPEVPGVVIEVHRKGRNEVWVPVLDAQGRALLDPGSCELLTALGWTRPRHRNVLTRALASPQEASQAAAHVLIEVLHVPHPADLDHLVSVPS